MLRRLDDRDLVAQVDGLRALAAAARARPAAPAPPSSAISRASGQAALVNRDCGSAREQAADTPRSRFPRTPSHRRGSTASGRSTRSAPSAVTSPSGVASNRPQYTSFIRASMHTRIRAPAAANCCATAARSEMPTVGKLRAEGESLRDADRDSHAGESRPDRGRRRVPSSCRRVQPALGEHLFDHRQDEVGVSALVSQSRARRCARR